MSEELKTGVLDAYLFLRKNNHDIPDNILEFINNSVDKIKQLEQENLELKKETDKAKSARDYIFIQKSASRGM